MECFSACEISASLAEKSCRLPDKTISLQDLSCAEDLSLDRILGASKLLGHLLVWDFVHKHESDASVCRVQLADYPPEFLVELLPHDQNVGHIGVVRKDGGVLTVVVGLVIAVILVVRVQPAVALALIRRVQHI